MVDIGDVVIGPRLAMGKEAAIEAQWCWEQGCCFCSFMKCCVAPWIAAWELIVSFSPIDISLSIFDTWS